MNVIRDLHVDWTEAAALEFLGPPGYNMQYQARIQQILNNLGRMNGYSLSIDRPINVRCDDWAHGCDNTVAYTVNSGPREMATINFCDDFFKQPDLFDQVSAGENAGDYRWKYNMRNYDTSKGKALHWSRKKYCLSKY
jgi:hypothetical protein